MSLRLGESTYIYMVNWSWYERLYRNEYKCQWEPTRIHDIVLLGQQPSAAMAHRRRLGSQFPLVALLSLIGPWFMVEII